MWIVRLALRRPLSVAVMALLMLVLGVLSFTRMNVDIFPEINLPVVMVVWNYPGLSTFDIERRMVLISERAYSTTVNGIEHMESESINGLGIMKVYFYPGSDIGSAIAQINAVSETILRILPRGTEPPQIISYNAGNVPVAQLNIYSDTLSTSRLFDYGLNFIRVQLFTIPGFSSPAPLGGVSRTVMVNLNPTALYANGMSAYDLGNALGQQQRGDSLRHHQDRQLRIRRRPQHERAQGLGLQHAADEVRRRRAGVPGRYRARHRHPSAADQRGAGGRQAGDLPDGDQARRRLDAPGRRCGAQKDSADSRHRAQGPAGIAQLRSVQVRARRAVGRGSGGGHRGGAGGADGAAVPGLAAQHVDRNHVDTAVDPDLDYRAQPVWADDQHDDAGRNRVGGRDAGGRRDRGGREHPSQPRDEQAAAGGDPRRRLADRRRRPLPARSPSASCSFRSSC